MGDKEKSLGQETLLPSYICRSFSKNDLDVLCDTLDSFKINHTLERFDKQVAVGSYCGHSFFSLIESQVRLVEQVYQVLKR